MTSTRQFFFADSFHVKEQIPFQYGGLVKGCPILSKAKELF
jgi:hypothetical protein